MSNTSPLPPSLPEKHSSALTEKERIKLIHQGNVLFNQKDYRMAEKIFLAVDYRDGIDRLARYYFSRKAYFRAAELFRKIKNLKGEYCCYLLLGLVRDIRDYHNLSTRKEMDEKINLKLAHLIQQFLEKHP